MCSGFVHQSSFVLITDTALAALYADVLCRAGSVFRITIAEISHFYSEVVEKYAMLIIIIVIFEINNSKQTVFIFHLL
jgi:hypothetical protein